MSARRYAVSTELRELIGDHVEVVELDEPESAFSPESILGSQIRATAGDAGMGIGGALMMLYARLSESTDCDVLLRALERVERFFVNHPQTHGSVDVILLLAAPTIGNAAGGGAPDPAASLARIEQHLAEVGESTAGHEIRVWLLGQLAQNGTTYAFEDVIGLLRGFTPADVAAGIPQTAGNYYTLGGRAFVFPRNEIMEHLANHYALRVLSLEDKWLARKDLVPYASVAEACAEFLDDVVIPAAKRMDVAPDGTSMFNAPEMPIFQSSEPLAAVQSRVEMAVEVLMDKLGEVESQIAQNYERVLVEVKTQFKKRLASLVDTAPYRTLLARAFLDVLETGVTECAKGSQSSWSGKKSLRDGYSASIEFLDRVSEFDTKQRSRFTELVEDIGSREEQIERLEEDLARERRVSEGDDSPRAEVLATALDQAKQDLARMQGELAGVERDVYAQDVNLDPANARTLKAKISADTAAEAARALEALGTTASAVEQCREALRTAEAQLADLVRKILWRIGSAVFFALLIAIAGVFALPLLFGAVPIVGPPLFGFVGTLVGAVWLRSWGIAAGVGLFLYVVAQASAYLGLRRVISEKQSELDAAEGSHRAALRSYWEASVARFTMVSQLEKHLRIMGLERELRETLEQTRVSLVEFEDELCGLRERLREDVEGFALVSTVTELVAVGGDYADQILADKESILDGVSRKFLQPQVAVDAAASRRRAVSRYFEEFRRSSGLELLMRDLREDCEAEVFWDLKDRTVLEAARQVDPEFGELRRAVSALTVLLPLSEADSAGKKFTLVLAPDKASAESAFSALSPRPMVREHDDSERLVMFRVVYDVERKDIVVL